MCLIIHRPTEGKRGKGANVPLEVLRTNSRANPDGFGIAWREEGKVRFEKFAPGDYGRFEERVRAIDRDNSIEYVAHFRKATHGPACLDLSHPFVYDDPKVGDTLVFHNGIIDIETDSTAIESDTSAFVDNVLRSLKPLWWHDGALRFLVEGAIGWSRLLIMTAAETVRLNESKWTKRGGIWYSTAPYGYSYSAGGYSELYPKGSASTGGTAGRGGWSGGGGSDIDDDDDEEAYALKLLAPVAAQATRVWTHMGHVVHPLSAETDDEGDVSGQVSCEACKTVGDYYRIQGSVYVDLKHLDTDNTTDRATEA